MRWFLYWIEWTQNIFSVCIWIFYITWQHLQVPSEHVEEITRGKGKVSIATLMEEIDCKMCWSLVKICHLKCIWYWSDVFFWKLRTGNLPLTLPIECRSLFFSKKCYFFMLTYDIQFLEPLIFSKISGIVFYICVFLPQFWIFTTILCSDSGN